MLQLGEAREHGIVQLVRARTVQAAHWAVAVLDLSGRLDEPTARQYLVQLASGASRFARIVALKLLPPARPAFQSLAQPEPERWYQMVNNFVLLMAWEKRIDGVEDLFPSVRRRREQFPLLETRSSPPSS